MIHAHSERLKSWTVWRKPRRLAQAIVSTVIDESTLHLFGSLTEAPLVGSEAEPPSML